MCIRDRLYSAGVCALLAFLCSLSGLLGCRGFELRVRVSAGGGGFLVGVVVVSLLCRLLAALVQYSDNPPSDKCRLLCTGVVCRCVYWTAVVAIDGF